MIRYRYLYSVLVLVLCLSSLECARSRTAPPPLPPEPVTANPPLDREEVAIRSVLDNVELAMEQGDVYKVLMYVSASYRDKQERDYTDLRLLLQRVFARYATIDIARSDTKVTIDENRAAVTENFDTFARTRPETDVEPLTLRGMTSVFLEKIAGRWLIVEWGESS
jgi:hypothetical protein